MTADWSALGQNKGGGGDSIIYYRKPNKGVEAGWIVFGDSLSGTKLRDFVKRGFEPLMQFGSINDRRRDMRAFGTKDSPIAPEYESLSPNEHRARYEWEGILTHPDGPAAFPVEQIIAYRWYRPENCPVPDAYFPQLAGKKIREYNCPERCGRNPFVDVDGVGGVSALRSHLRIMHEWDQANLQAYGARVGIDFNASDVGELLIQDVNVAEQGEAVTCETCGEEFRGGFKEARLGKHRRSHGVVDVVTV